MRKISGYLIILLLLLTGCGRSKTSVTSPRYVILSPELAEWVVRLDGMEHIVGVTQECDYPATLRNVTKVGNFGAINLEAVLKTKPTLVLSSSLEQDAIGAKLRKLGVHTESFYPHSLADLDRDIPRLAALLQRQDEAKALLDSLHTGLQSLTSDRESHPRVYLEIYGQPLMSADTTSFVGDLLRKAGGDNIFPHLIRDYCAVNAEDILRADPEVIIIAYPGVHKTDIQNRKGWERVSACRTGRIYTLDDYDPNLVLRAGPRVLDGIRLLHRLLHENP